MAVVVMPVADVRRRKNKTKCPDILFHNEAKYQAVSVVIHVDVARNI